MVCFSFWSDVPFGLFCSFNESSVRVSAGFQSLLMSDLSVVVFMLSSLSTLIYRKLQKKFQKVLYLMYSFTEQSCKDTGKNLCRSCTFCSHIVCLPVFGATCVDTKLIPWWRWYTVRYFRCRFCYVLCQVAEFKGFTGIKAMCVLEMNWLIRNVIRPIYLWMAIFKGR